MVQTLVLIWYCLLDLWLQFLVISDRPGSELFRTCVLIMDQVLALSASCYWSGHAHGACARALQQQLAVITDYWTWSQSGPSSEAEHDSLPSSEAFCVHINRNSGIVNKASSQTTRTGLDPMRTRLQIFGVTEHSDGIPLPKLNPVSFR
ncbi:hypothetical protein AMECASPLE_036210 [Ameca splendens]|uniref:Uncharacterized protein n=1 Tax=Ameca splendens TaxID=208324 RepID=A0ABV0Y7N1_9TELE